MKRLSLLILFAIVCIFLLKQQQALTLPNLNNTPTTMVQPLNGVQLTDDTLYFSTPYDSCHQAVPMCGDTTFVFTYPPHQ